MTELGKRVQKGTMGKFNQLNCKAIDDENNNPSIKPERIRI